MLPTLHSTLYIPVAGKNANNISILVSSQNSPGIPLTSLLVFFIRLERTLNFGLFEDFGDENSRVKGFAVQVKSLRLMFMRVLIDGAAADR